MEETRICVDCGFEKPLDQYSKSQTKAKPNRRKVCRPCMYTRTKKANPPSYTNRHKYRNPLTGKIRRDTIKDRARAMARHRHGSAKWYHCAVPTCDKMADQLHHLNYAHQDLVVALCRDHHNKTHE